MKTLEKKAPEELSSLLPPFEAETQRHSPSSSVGILRALLIQDT